jgi:hypothetical protein
MRTRGFLLVAVLTSLSVILFVEFQARPKLRRLVEQRDQHAQSLAQEQQRSLGLEQAVQEARGRVAALGGQWADAQAALASTQSRLETERARRSGVETDLSRTKEKVEILTQALVLERGVGNQLTQLQARNAALAARNDTLAKRVAELEDMVGPYPPPPPDLRAKVLAVDPKWGFVVLDIGRSQRARPTWSFLVHRDGVLVGKVEITTVLQDHSIANLLPGWTRSEVREGDQALPHLQLAQNSR